MLYLWGHWGQVEKNEIPTGYYPDLGDVVGKAAKVAGFLVDY
jgi:hypothetical protein